MELSFQPQLLAVTSCEDIHTFDYESLNNQLSDDEIGIGTSTRLYLIGNSDEIEGTQFFCIRSLFLYGVC